MHSIPEGCPGTLFEAFAHIAAAEAPTVDTLKVMVMVEAAGKALYDDMALGTDNAEVQALLRHNGREELAHAHRVAKAIGAITGTAYPVPGPAENPYLVTPPPRAAVTRESLLKLAEAEFGGEDLYARWASNVGVEEAAALFRLNGREETEHGGRLQQAAELLPA
jgi:rubrerythrin